VLDGHLVDVLERLFQDGLEATVDFGLGPIQTGPVLDPLKVRDRDAPGVGQDVRDDDDAPSLQDGVGF